MPSIPLKQFIFSPTWEPGPPPEEEEEILITKGGVSGGIFLEDANKIYSIIVSGNGSHVIYKPKNK